MFSEKGSIAGRKNRITVGYDLGDQSSQISFWQSGAEEPETFSVVTGKEQYSFSTLLCHSPNTDQWAFGREAEKLAQQGQATAAGNLLTLARQGEEVKLGEERYDPVALLTLFLKRSLSLLGLSSLTEQIETLMITVERLDGRTLEVLTQAAAAMRLQTAHVSFQSHVESFYHYMIHQPEELWIHRALACDYENGRLLTYVMECNRGTTPIAAFVDVREYPGQPAEDGAFYKILEENCKDRIVSSAWLLGRGFEEEWYPESLRYLCHGRRVFRGNNLYSKGACYGAREKGEPKDTGKRYVFLGGDKLKANLGLQVLRRGKDSYYALLDAGTNWYEAKAACEFYLESGNSFTLVLTPLSGKESREKEIEIILNDLPVREGRAIRIGLTVSMRSRKDIVVTAEDLGFGEIYPASHRIWQEEFSTE